MRLVSHLSVRLSLLVSMVAFTSGAMAAQNWTVDPKLVVSEKIKSIRAASQAFDLKDQEAADRIRQDLAYQGVDIRMLEVNRIEALEMDEELYPNSHSNVEAIRRGSDLEDVSRYYLLGGRDASLTNPDWGTYAVVARVRFSFEGVLKNLKIKKFTPRVYTAEEKD